MSSLIVEVCKISNIEKHPNADRLAIATVKGWNCIIGINDFKIGDNVIFIPPDAVIPEKMVEEYNLTYLPKNRRVKTVKLRQYISQGIVLPIPKDQNWKEGKNVASYFGIVKYEPPELQIAGQHNKETILSLWKKLLKKDVTIRRFIFKSLGLIKDKFFKKRKTVNPNFNKYTEIENIKNYNSVFQLGEKVIITEKIHGTNFRAGNLKKHSIWNITNKYEFVFGSHNVQFTPFKKKNFYEGNVYETITRKYNLDKIIPEGYIVYGEIYGGKPAIQKNYHYGLTDNIDVRFFDVKYNGKYLDYNTFFMFCFERNLPIVPELYKGILNSDTIKKYTEGQSILYPKHIREGCVVRPEYEEFHKRLGRKILKSINPEYLLKDQTEYK